MESTQRVDACVGLGLLVNRQPKVAQQYFIIPCTFFSSSINYTMYERRTYNTSSKLVLLSKFSLPLHGLV